MSKYRSVGSSYWRRADAEDRKRERAIQQESNTAQTLKYNVETGRDKTQQKYFETKNQQEQENAHLKSIDEMIDVLVAKIVAEAEVAGDQAALNKYEDEVAKMADDAKTFKKIFCAFSKKLKVFYIKLALSRPSMMLLLPTELMETNSCRGAVSHLSVEEIKVLDKKAAKVKDKISEVYYRYLPSFANRLTNCNDAIYMISRFPQTYPNLLISVKEHLWTSDEYNLRKLINMPNMYKYFTKDQITYILETQKQLFVHVLCQNPELFLYIPNSYFDDHFVKGFISPRKCVELRELPEFDRYLAHLPELKKYMLSVQFNMPRQTGSSMEM